ncbi:Epoxide Hydratase [Hyphodiscus hymeniophilus]|uniref:Epoxide Hydratase n=1 Tax=Hyphodiscus hymeniophilus TaxID=353542 RepID=A0A9P6VJD0_9HELO|nr:Epoxide Hydratase [Hyphodiscus hymeniophilus]
MDIKPFKVSIPSSELVQLHEKLLLTRLPKAVSGTNWTPDSKHVTVGFLEAVLKTWLTTYSWKDTENKLNSLPQFITTIPLDGFGDLTIQFVHSPSNASLKGQRSIPLLFLHGWPGSILEVSKALPLFNEKGFDVVAPALPGWLSSTLPTGNGFKVRHHAEIAHKLMLKLGYDEYVLQGGDWGGQIAPTLAIHPEPTFAPEETQDREAKGYTPFEENSLSRFREFKKHGTAYVEIQQAKPLTLGVGLHDSPMGLLAWIADKILDWSDSFPRNPKGYKWTNEELITWTLLHYFGDLGPIGPFHMYVANRLESEDGEWEWKGMKYVQVLTGVSALRWENEMVPRAWAEREAKVVWWREHERGGHFAVYEMPEEMVQDVVDFTCSIGIRRGV